MEQIRQTEESLTAAIRKRQKEIETLRDELDGLRFDLDKTKAANEADSKKVEELLEKKVPAKAKALNALILLGVGILLGFIVYLII